MRRAKPFKQRPPYYILSIWKGITIDVAGVEFTLSRALIRARQVQLELNKFHGFDPTWRAFVARKVTGHGELGTGLLLTLSQRDIDRLRILLPLLSYK